MTADGVLRGWATPSPVCKTALMFHREGDGIEFPDSRRVLIVPDDGTQVVVTVGEWERLQGLAWVVCASVVQRVDYDNDAAFRNDVRNLLEIVKESGPRAILGTEGGGE